MNLYSFIIKIGREGQNEVNFHNRIWRLWFVIIKINQTQGYIACFRKSCKYCATGLKHDIRGKASRREHIEMPCGITFTLASFFLTMYDIGYEIWQVCGDLRSTISG